MGKKAGKIALGLGLLTGAITGLLLAPEEGRNLRKKLAKGDTKGLFKDLELMGEEIKKMAVDLSKRPSVKEALEKAKDRAADVADLKREELDDLLRDATKKANTFKDKIAVFVKEQKDALEEHLKEKGVKKPAKKAKAKKSSVKKAKKSPKKKSVKLAKK
ncbi:MAG: YtxH domain-containing protein [Candidatus Gracilibacteria bacterium]